MRRPCGSKLGTCDVVQMHLVSLRPALSWCVHVRTLGAGSSCDRPCFGLIALVSATRQEWMGTCLDCAIAA